MKKIVLTSAVIFIVILAMACAGCSSTKTTGSTPASTGNAGSAASSGGAAASAPAAASCPAVTAANSWTGKWDTWLNGDVCYDGRQKFYPVTQDHPDPWDGVAGDIQPQGTFTQTGCAVTGSYILGESGVLIAPHGCPISFTGTVDASGRLSGTWKAYCNIQFSGTDKTPDSGVFDLSMNPDGNGFAGKFSTTDSDQATYIANNCANAESNWVGKRTT
jgi:hypothetical protein